MKLNLPVILCLASLSLVSGCQTVANETAPIAANFDAGLLPVAIPVQVSYQDEVNLLRLNQILAEQPDLGSADRARLLYERGLIYDRMGLTAHSRYDLNQAINTDPTFAPAYNILGLYLLLSRSFDEAFEAFDSAIELAEGMEYSYLHRAIGLYQIHRYSLASSDINSFFEMDSNDPYRVLWRYIIDTKIDPKKALAELQNSQQLDSDNRFAWSLVDVLAQRVTEQQFFKSIANGVYSNHGLAQRLCEAYFYLGHWHNIGGDHNRAIHYFKLAMTSNIHDFIEYKYALIELESMQIEFQSEN